MLNGTLTGRRAAALLAIMAALLGVALLLAYAGVPGAEAQSPPATPSSVTLTRADGTVTASWPAVSGATKYHVTYSSDNKQSWSATAGNHAGTTITISGADNAKSYVVAVRAGNDAGQWSGWRNSDAIGPYTPDPTPTPTPDPDPPGTPSSVTVTRGDGTVTADWPDVSGATKYHVTYSTDNKQSWSLATSARPYSDITINGADNSKTYIVAVRAGNDAGWSGWRNSAPAAPYAPEPTPTPTPTPTPMPTPTPTPQTAPGTPASVTVTRGDGTVTASWPAVSGATKYHITYSANGKRTWTAASDSHTGTTITINNANNGKTYYVAVRAGNSAGWSDWRNSPASAPITAPGIIVQDTSGNAITTLSVPEGGEASYQVKLATKPDAYVEICIGLSVRDRNDGSITFKGKPTGTVAIKVPFTPENWDTAQTVTLVAAEDDDAVNGVRDVINDTRDFVEYFSGAVWLEVTEVDNDPPGAPANVSIQIGDGYLDIAWGAVSGATGYDVKAKTAGSSDWTDVASNITTTSHRYTTDATIDQVGVRARNANGPGPWTELPSAPASVTVTRSDGAIIASWPPVSGAAGYAVTYSAVGSGNWITAASNQAATSITINGVNNDHTYLVGASSRNKYGESTRTVSPAAGPYSKRPPATPLSVTVLRANGALTAI